MRLPGFGVDCECMRSALRRRRAGAIVLAPSIRVVDFGLACDSAAVPSARRRSRKTVPNTADRDIPPRWAAITAAASPVAQSFFNRSIRSAAHAASCIVRTPMRGRAWRGAYGWKEAYARRTASPFVTISLVISDSQVTVLDASQPEPNW